MAPRRAAAVSAANNMAAAAAAAQKSVTSGVVTTSKQGDKSTAAPKKEQASSTASTSSRPPPAAIPPSPIVERLRKTWKFAAICQFLFTFDEAFGMSGFESDALESDLDSTETRVIPDLMRRLLYTLTLNRSIDEENWEDHLRLQYLKREPDEPLLGTIDEPFSWHALSLIKKVDSIHQLCEWQLWDAERFRKLVKNEEDAHVWRIDPIGWDAQDNTYWLFDDNRLWIQHPPPPPPLAKAPPKKSSKKAKAEARREAQKRKREAAEREDSAGTPSRARKQLPIETPMRSSPRNRRNAESTPPTQKRSRPTRGRRTDEWEEIPPELLADGTGDDSKDAGDDDSDLSDPPEEEKTDLDESIVPPTEELNNSTKPEPEQSVAMDIDIAENDTKVDATEAEARDAAATSHPNGEQEDTPAQSVKEEEGETKAEPAVEEVSFVEFEALVITRTDWEWMSSRFAKSKHPDEKALHQLLKETVLPKVMADLEEAEKQRLHELAMANRKRSSRIALKESEKEERERDRIARQRMEEKMTAIRDEEEAQIRREREEKDAVRIREERLREREERAAAREREAIDRALREAEERESRERMREMRKLKREQIIANGGQPPDDDSALDSMVTTPAPAADEDNWELDCEVCGKHGVNLEETGEIVCCEDCGVWQHIRCWDAFDRRCDRPRRDWEKEDFYCSRCRPPLPGQPVPEGPRDRQKAQQQNSAGRLASEKPSSPSVAAATPQANAVQSAPQDFGRGPVQGVHSFPAGLTGPHPHHYPSYTTIYGSYGGSNGNGSASYTQAPRPASPYSHPPPVQQQPMPTQYSPVSRPVQQPAQHQQSFQQQFHPHQVQQAQIPQHYFHPPQQSQQQHLPLQQRWQDQPTHQQRYAQQYSPPQQFNAPRPDGNAVPSQYGFTGSQQHQHQPQHQHQHRPPSVPQPPQSRPAAHAPSAPVTRDMPPTAVSSQTHTNAPSLPPSSQSPAPVNVSGSSTHPPNDRAPTASQPSNSPSTAGPPPTQGNGVHPTSKPSPSPSSVGAAAKAPSPQQHQPMRSPTSTVPRNVSSQASGSFPMRYASARSPLSGPHHSPMTSTPSLPSVSLGPPARSGSPSPASKPSGAAPRPAHLEHALLHGRQTPQTPQAQNEARGGTAPGTGPGPAAGSLARVPAGAGIIADGAIKPQSLKPFAAAAAPSSAAQPVSSAAATAVANGSSSQGTANTGHPASQPSASARTAQADAKDVQQ